MTYSVKEIFYTLQGEGANTGKAAVFCRFSGCNLWTGRESDRASAICQFCDTDFVGTDGTGGGKFSTAQALAERIAQEWGGAVEDGERFVVCTGGEPLLQLDEALITALHGLGFKIAIETNGTLPVPVGVDWVCVSPKQGADLVVKQGDELKVVLPQSGQNLAQLSQLAFTHHFLQGMDGTFLPSQDLQARGQNTEAAIAYCQQHPKWRLSLQTHKIIGIR